MLWFDPPTMTYPKRWSEYSFDFKLFFVWEGGLMAAMILINAGSLARLDDRLYFGVLAFIPIGLFTASMLNRRRKDWHWPGLNTTDIFKAAAAAIVMMLFLYVFAQDLLPISRNTAPMLLFAVSIVLFNILNSLKLVQMSNDEFQQMCGNAARENALEAQPSAEQRWKRSARAIYSILFVLIWLEGMAFFYFHERFVREGSLKPTISRTEYLNEHGTLIYLTSDQKQVDDILSAIMMVGIPAAIAGGFFLHFIAGVPIFSNMRPSKGFFSRED